MTSKAVFQSLSVRSDVGMPLKFSDAKLAIRMSIGPADSTISWHFSVSVRSEESAVTIAPSFLNNSTVAGPI